jgi:calcineurin-like phosphoesterase family protein
MNECSYFQDEDNLFFVGDLVNKGPSSVDVIRTFREIGAMAVRGNHDDAAVRNFGAFQVWTSAFFL